MPNNIANKLVVNANTQKEIDDFLSAISGEAGGGRSLILTLKKFCQRQSAWKDQIVILSTPFTTTL
jgi:hypothetical protein